MSERESTPDEAMLSEDALDDGAILESSGGSPSEAERLRKEIGIANERLLRAQADLDNQRKRARRELEEELRFATLPLIRDLLPVVDNVSRAIEAAQKVSEAAAFIEGFKMVAQSLDTVLAAHGCKRIEALHQPFDPHLHQAVSQMPNDQYPPHTVVGIVQQGYVLNDRVVRPSQVIVSTPKPGA